MENQEKILTDVVDVQTMEEVSFQGENQADYIAEMPVIQVGIIPVIIGSITFLFAIGAAWGTMHATVKGIRKTLDEKIEPDVKDVREKFAVVEDRVDSMWKDKFAPASSPRKLNERGESVLNGSGIKDIIDNKRDKLLKIVKDREPGNAYDAERIILEVVQGLPVHCPEKINQIKEGAFRTGVDVGGVLFVGGIYLRDLIFEELNFNLDELDKK